MTGRVNTSIEVANRAGVSRSAVSRCFTPGASISDETRRKVMEAAKALGYRPNAIARSLNVGRSRMIAVVIGYMENQFYPALLDRLAQRLQSRAYRLLLFTSKPDGDCDELFAEILAYKVDGIILASTLLSSELAEECKSANIPVVLVNRTTDSANISSVTADNRDGARCVADFLLAGGHRRFGFIAGIASSSTNQDRKNAFLERLNEAGITDVIHAEGHYSQEGAQKAARELLGLRTQPDAIFCANDHMALAVMDVARYEFGLDIPGAISIVGYDDVGAAAWPSYNLTTVQQPVDAMAQAAVDSLMQRMESASVPAHTIRIPGDLVVRGSARRPSYGLLHAGGQIIWRPEAKKKKSQRLK